MKLRSILILLITVTFSASSLLSADGDTTKVRTVEFNTARAGWYSFPKSGEKKFRKIIMNFKIKCPDGKSCGEWDYISNVFIDKYFAPNFRIGGKSHVSQSFMTDTAWAFTPEKINDAWVLTKTPKPSKIIYFYNDTKLPTLATDSLVVWDTYFTYSLDAAGKKIDSALVAADSTVSLTKKRVYFKDEVTINERSEIMRYITPYGNGLKLGDGWLYTVDVTDFLPLLLDSIYIYAPCGGWGDQTSNTDQEALELSFDFIEGTPARDIIRLEKMWESNRAVYNGKFESLFPPLPVELAANEKGARLKVIQTGHGFGGNNDNCSEFCKKEANVKIDDQQRYARYIWRECGEIPLFPQGGTWINDRTNWCPGMDVEAHNYELTPYLTAGEPHTVDYSMEYYNTPYVDGSNKEGFWVISSYLITYSEPNFNLDAELVDIINPTQKQAYKRLNPSCFNYSVLIQNSGKEKITSVKFRLGFEGDESEHNFTWTGNMNFLDTATVTFYDFARSDNSQEARKFFVEIMEVNGKTDDYAANNTGVSLAPAVAYLPNDLSFNLKTNNYASQQYHFIVRDSEWNVIKERNTFSDNTNYAETMTLPDGCYDFQLTNKLGYGLYTFFMVQQLGTGAFNISSRGNTIATYNPDFGNYIYQQFRVGPVPEIAYSKDTVFFGTTLLGVETTQTLEISSKNNRDVTIYNANIFLGSSYGYRIISTSPELSANNPVTLKAGEKMTVTIGFNPKNEATTGANLTFETNDFYSTNHSVRLIGIGDDPNGVNEMPTATAAIDVTYNANMQTARIRLNTNATAGKTQVKVFDSMGNLIGIIYDQETMNGYDEFEYSTQALTSGAYYFVLQNGDKYVTKSFVIAK